MDFEFDIDADDLNALFEAPTPRKVAQSIEVSIEEYDEKMGPQLEVPCPDCKAPMRLKESRFGYFYGCTEFNVTGCKGTVKAYANGMLAAIPAPRETRQIRGEIMRRLDELVRAGTVSEKERYAFLSDLSGPRFQGVGSLDEAEGLKLLAAIREKNPTMWDVLEGDSII